MRIQRIAENYYLSLPIAIALALAPLLNWVGLAWAVFATLRQNLYLGMLSLGLVGGVNFYVFNNLRFNGTMGELLAFFVLVAPLWAMAYSLQKFRSLTLSLQLGFVIVVVCALLSYGIDGPIMYDELYQYMHQRFFGDGMPVASAGQTFREMYLDTMTKTTMIAWPMMLFLLQISLLLTARYFQSRWYNPGGFRTEFQGLRLSRYMAALLLLSILWTLFMPHVQVALQLAVLCIFVYSIAGIAWMHWYMNTKLLGTTWFVLFYIVLFGLSAWILPLLAMVALADSFLDLRTRTRGK
ncbi:MAG: hypothetical protein WC748_06985 [Legionellales bacterium]|jgi:hypothetical protein